MSLPNQPQGLSLAHGGPANTASKYNDGINVTGRYKLLTWGVPLDSCNVAPQGALQNKLVSTVAPQLCSGYSCED